MLTTRSAKVMRSLNPVTMKGMKEGFEGSVVWCSWPETGEEPQKPTAGMPRSCARAREHSPYRRSMAAASKRADRRCDSISFWVRTETGMLSLETIIYLASLTDLILKI